MRRRAGTCGRAWGRRAARWHVLDDARSLQRRLKLGASAVEATEGRNTRAMRATTRAARCGIARPKRGLRGDIGFMGWRRARQGSRATGGLLKRGAPSSAPVEQLLAFLGSRCRARWPSRGRPHRSCQTCAATAAPCALTSAYASSATPPPRRPVSTNPEACVQVAPSVRDAGARGWNSGQRSKSPQSGALAGPHLGVRARRNSLSMGPVGAASGTAAAEPARALQSGPQSENYGTFGNQ